MTTFVLTRHSPNSKSVNPMSSFPSAHPSRNAAGAVDGPREPGGRPLHAHVGQLVVRRAPLRDDHLRQLPLPGDVQQPGARPGQVREHPQHSTGDQT